MNLFHEIARTNATYCESLGLPSDTYTRPLADAEINGTPLSADEQIVAEEIGHLVDRGMPLAKARRWAPVNVRQGVSNKPHGVIEYAVKNDRNELFALALGKYYSECRARGPVCFVGD
jgi:hypothetical protein